MAILLSYDLSLQTPNHPLQRTVEMKQNVLLPTSLINLGHLLILLKVISIGFSSPRSIVYKDHRNAQGEFPAVLDSWLDEEDLTQGIFVTMLSKLIERIPKQAFS